MAQLNAGKRQELLTLREHLSSPRVVLFWVFVFVFVFLFFFGGGVRVAHLFSFLCCPIMCFYVLSSVL